MNRTSFKGSRDTIVHIGMSDMLIGGFYEGYYTFREMKEYGDFGIGAPDRLNGEIVMADGKAYQTIYTGETFEGSDYERVALAFVHFFETDTERYFNVPVTMHALYAKMGDLINYNEPTAIRITGEFLWVKTRAFPPVLINPSPPMAELADEEQFFEYFNVKGVLLGYYTPAFLRGINITGFHLHFLSADQQKGGHVIDFVISNVRVELDVVYNLAVLLPPVAGFKDFNFNTVKCKHCCCGDFFYNK